MVEYKSMLKGLKKSQLKRRIDTGAGNPEALSRQVVEELAVRIANSRIK